MVTEEAESRYLNEHIGIFRLKEIHPVRLKDTRGVPLAALSETVGKRSYEYRAWVAIDESAVEKARRAMGEKQEIRIFTGAQIAIEFGKATDSQQFLEKWPATNEYLGIRLAQGAICGFTTRRWWAQFFPIPVYHYALCFAFHVELDKNGELVVPPKLLPLLKRGKRPDVDALGAAAIRHFVQEKKIACESVFPFPAREPKIWRPGLRR